MSDADPPAPTEAQTEPLTEEVPRDFIRDIVRADLASGRESTVVTRFPPEPNGYLHIGHAKSICLNFGVAAEFGGRCHLRFDDTNPLKEEQLYIDAIKADVRWLGFDWGDHLFHASDHFDRLYDWAEHLVEQGLAYVDDQTAGEVRASRGTLTEPGTDSPYRGRTPAENLDLLRRMKAGEFPEGARVLRAKIDMASGNINLRDPVLYRILHAAHPRTGARWKIYPTYDFAHGQSDAIEQVTHSICTMEFEDHRPLYEWLIGIFLAWAPEEQKVEGIVDFPREATQTGFDLASQLKLSLLFKSEAFPGPRQYEFARLNLGHTVLSKRRLIRLVGEGHVAGWDDPRMPTLAGLRRRGVPPEGIREFIRRIGVAKADNLVEAAQFDAAVRDVLNESAPRRMAVLDPLRVVIENWPEGEVDWLPAANHPADPDRGTRDIPFGRELWIERADFMEDPPRKFFRLAPGREVRLRFAYLATCTDVVRDAAGEIAELRCVIDPASRGGTAPDGRKVRGTIHWVSAAHALDAEVRLYDRLFSAEIPGSGGRDWLDDLNPASLTVVPNAKLEPALADAEPGETLQFERTGYFAPDPDGFRDGSPARPVFNRAVTLRDSWAKQAGR